MSKKRESFGSNLFAAGAGTLFVCLAIFLLNLAPAGHRCPPAPALTVYVPDSVIVSSRPNVQMLNAEFVSGRDSLNPETLRREGVIFKIKPTR